MPDHQDEIPPSGFYGRLSSMKSYASPLSFLTILSPKRPDFLATMTPEEKAVMGQHLAYTWKLFDQGKIVLGGAPPTGPSGSSCGGWIRQKKCSGSMKPAAGQGPSGPRRPRPWGGVGRTGDGMRMIRPRLIIMSQPRPGSDSRPSAGRVGSVENPK